MIISSDRPAARYSRFLLCGGIAAAVNWGSRFFWSLSVPFGAAVILAHLTGMVVAFALFQRFVFTESVVSLRRQITAFAGVNAVSIVITYCTAKILFPLFALILSSPTLSEAGAHSVAVLTPCVTSWVGHQYLTFRTGRFSAGAVGALSDQRGGG